MTDRVHVTFGGPDSDDDPTFEQRTTQLRVRAASGSAAGYTERSIEVLSDWEIESSSSGLNQNRMTINGNRCGICVASHLL